jgi:hypothetical protein
MKNSYGRTIRFFVYDQRAPIGTAADVFATEEEARAHALQMVAADIYRTHADGIGSYFLCGYQDGRDVTTRSIGQ